MLQIWKDHRYGGIATRQDLVNDLSKNQLANSCNPLILALKSSELKEGIQNFLI